MRMLLLILALSLALSGCASVGETTGPEEAFPEAQTVPAPAEGTEEVSLPPTTVPLTEEEQLARLLRFQLNAMTDEQRVGQLILGRCPESGALEDLSAYHLAGYVLFSQDFEGETPASLREKLDSYREASYLPPIFAVDEEGGTVTRVSSVKAFRDTPLPSPRRLYSEGGLEAVMVCELEKVRLLKALGLNVNLGPVCDIARDPGDFMYSRSLGQDAGTTGRFASETALLYQSNGLGCVLKHFPGYGSNGDTHTGLVYDSRPLEALEENDLVPFQMAIDAGAGAIMVSHTVVEAMDSAWPASLSPAVHGYLREKMRFQGVIVTDDLHMQAISDLYGPGEAAVLAVLAGNDLICTTDYAQAHAAILEAVHSGRIPRELLDQAVLRVLGWKNTLGILFQ